MLKLVQHDKYMSYLKRFWPYLFLLFLVILLFVLNYHPGTVLTGGDNLHPEYNFAVNIRRSIFSVWQEYQGLGLLGGMGHAADLVRQLFLWFLSLFLPTEFLRYFWTFLTLFLGAAGAYELIRFLLTDSVIARRNDEAISYRNIFFLRKVYKRLPRSLSVARNDKNEQHNSEKDYSPFAIGYSPLALLGASYYLLNLSTVQSYYTPFEVFTAHFASLPWLLLLGTRYLMAPSRKTLLLFALLLLLSTPAAYVPTLFVVFLMALGIIWLTFLFIQPDDSPHPNPLPQEREHKHFFSPGERIKVRGTFFHGLKLFLLIFLINAFWLLPFAYFTLTKSSVNVEAKINQMATETIYLLNKEQGGIRDAIMLRGFWFNNVEPNFQGLNVYMLQNWRDYIANPLVQGIGYLLFAVILLGFITSILRRRLLLWPFAIIAAVTFCMLVTATPPFSWINLATRDFLPLFSQVFRFPFTKFSILASLMYAIFFTVGSLTLLSWLSKRFTLSALRYALPVILFALCCSFVFPVFQGHLLYDKERLKLPSDYQQLFSFFNDPSHEGRIANFPVNTFWDWKFNSWGYSGSGFLWYGIENPILDRAFDMFSREDENAYNELAQAVYAKDSSSLLTVLQKYQIRWIVLDTSITYPQSPKSLFYPELATLFMNAHIQKQASWGQVSVYSVPQTDSLSHFIFTTHKLPVVNAYAWNDSDQAYAEVGNYQTATDLPAGKHGQQPMTNDHQSYFYPFRSLFSLKTQDELSYHLTENPTTLTLTSPTALPPTIRTLQIPSFLQTENNIPVQYTIHKDKTAYIVRVELLLPQILIGTTAIPTQSISKDLFQIPLTATATANLNSNGITDYPVPPGDSVIGTGYLPLQQDSIFTLSGGGVKTAQTITLPASFFASLPQLQAQTVPLSDSDVVQVVIPKVTNSTFSFTPRLTSLTTAQNCDYFREGSYSVSYSLAAPDSSPLHLSSKDATACIAYYTDALDHAESYAIFVTANYQQGRSLHTWILNEDEKYAPLETYLPSISGNITSTFILPPQDPFGKAYSIHFDNSSIGQDSSASDLLRVAMYPLPYEFLTSLVAANQPVIRSQAADIHLHVQHPNESVYTMQMANGKWQMGDTLVLSQGFDDGWQAYAVTNSTSSLQQLFPFLFGKQLTHIEVNNWENGWLLPANGQRPMTNDQIVILYIPQFLEYFGFLLLAGTGVYLSVLFFKKKQS